MVMVSTVSLCLSGCSFANLSETSSIKPEPETVIVKETVIVTETVFVTEPDSEEKVEATTKEDDTSEATDSKGYTTQDVLKKADEASDNQYWIVFFGEGALRVATFNALENFTVKWTAVGELVCDKLVGISIVKKWDSDKSTFSGKEGRTDVAFRASEIVGSNCDIYDEKCDTVICDTVIKEKTE